MILRKASAADVPSLRAMLQRLSDHDGGDYPVGSEAALLAGGFGPHPLFHAVIAEDPSPLGMVIYYPDFSTHRGAPGVYIQDLWVDPETRGTGLGRRLLAEAMAQQDWGAAYMVLGASPENDLAMGFYAKVGFERRGYEYLILAGDGLKALQTPK